jgi:putative transposase
LVTGEGLSSKEAARRLSLPPSTMANWVKVAKTGKLGEIGKTQRPLTEIELEMAKTKRELAEVKMERDLLKKRRRTLPGKCGEVKMMKELQGDYPVPFMSRIYDVSPSGFYAWQGRPPSKRAREEARLEVEIRAAHQRTRETYDPERLQEDLADNGVNTTVHRVKRIRRKLGIRCKQKRKFKATTNSNHTLPVAPNLLEQKFTATAPNQVWLTDSPTFRPMKDGYIWQATKTCSAATWWATP